MARFSRKDKKGAQAISTASLPDIVFMLLFFFMVVTVMREDEVDVEVTKPEATEMEKIVKKHLVAYINVGVPFDQDKYGDKPRISLDGKIQNIEDIQPWIEKKRNAIVLEDERNGLIVSIKADKDVKMGLISDIKQELRQAQALKVNYSANDRSKLDD